MYPRLNEGTVSVDVLLWTWWWTFSFCVYQTCCSLTV